MLPPNTTGKEYTLVLDLDETLLHFDDRKDEVRVRPFALDFLEQMSRYYEIVIFTAGMRDYADWAIKHIGPQPKRKNEPEAAAKYISHRLYREHALPCKEFYIKDLSQINRDLSKTMIVDNTSECFLLQPENGITIKSWYDDPHD